MNLRPARPPRQPGACHRPRPAFVRPAITVRASIRPRERKRDARAAERQWPVETRQRVRQAKPAQSVPPTQPGPAAQQAASFQTSLARDYRRRQNAERRRQETPGKRRKPQDSSPKPQDSSSKPQTSVPRHQARAIKPPAPSPRAASALAHRAGLIKCRTTGVPPVSRRSREKSRRTR